MAEKESRNLRSVTVEKLTGGFLLREEYDPPSFKSGQMPVSYPVEKPEVFTSGEQVLAAVR